MERRNFMALLGSAAALMPSMGTAAAHGLPGDRLAGTWSYVSSVNTRKDGSIVDRWGDNARGILMFDGDGNERSGYGTSNGPGAVLFTLDTLSGDAAHFTARDEGGVDLWLSENGNQVRLAATEKGASISASQNGTVVFEQPQKKEGDR